MDLTVSREDMDGIAVIRPQGEVDVYTAPTLKEHLLGAFDSGRTRMVIDLSGVGFLDSSGLGVLVGALKRANEASGALRIVCSSDPILKIFRLTGLDAVFAIDPDIDSATSAIFSDA